MKPVWLGKHRFGCGDRETAMQKTRSEILNILKRSHKATLEELAVALKLAPITVRAHIAILERDGLITAEEVRGKVGRPYYLYSLTEQAQALFPQNYDTLLNRVMDSLSALEGQAKVNQLMEYIASRWAAERAERVSGKGLAERVREVTAIRQEEGAMAEQEKVPEGYMLLQHNCPAHNVATSHPEICDAERQYLNRLLGVDVTRVEWMANGQARCAYLIRERNSTTLPQRTNS